MSWPTTSARRRSPVSSGFWQRSRQRNSPSWNDSGRQSGRTVYDLAGRTAAAINPLLERTSTVYDVASQSISSIDPLLRRSSTVYDLAGRSISSINPLLQRITTVYDLAGESVSSIDPLLRRSSTVYDLASRTIASIDALSQRTTSVFDAAGQSVSNIDPLNRRSSSSCVDSADRYSIQNLCHSDRYAMEVLKQLEKADKLGSEMAIVEALNNLTKWHMNCNDPGETDEETDEDK